LSGKFDVALHPRGRKFMLKFKLCRKRPVRNAKIYFSDSAIASKSKFGTKPIKLTALFEFKK